jgi:adiponectin receptor
MTTIKEELVRLEKAAEARFTVLWHEVEEWQRDNIFIQRGYRPPSNSYRKSAKRLVPTHPLVS